jgi:hypothetical protein
MGKSYLAFDLIVIIIMKFGMVTENNIGLPTCHV